MIEESMDSDSSDGVFPVNRILEEKGSMYKVDWEGIDPKTGEPWKPTWVLKKNCTPDLIAEWKLHKKAKLSRKSLGRRKSTSSISKPASKTPIKRGETEEEEEEEEAARSLKPSSPKSFFGPKSAQAKHLKRASLSSLTPNPRPSSSKLKAEPSTSSFRKVKTEAATKPKTRPAQALSTPSFIRKKRKRADTPEEDEPDDNEKPSRHSSAVPVSPTTSSRVQPMKIGPPPRKKLLSSLRTTQMTPAKSTPKSETTGPVHGSEHQTKRPSESPRKGRLAESSAASTSRIYTRKKIHLEPTLSDLDDHEGLSPRDSPPTSPRDLLKALSSAATTPSTRRPRDIRQKATPETQADHAVDVSPLGTQSEPHQSPIEHPGALTEKEPAEDVHDEDSDIVFLGERHFSLVPSGDEAVQQGADLTEAGMVDGSIPVGGRDSTDVPRLGQLDQVNSAKDSPIPRSEPLRKAISHRPSDAVINLRPPEVIDDSDAAEEPAHSQEPETPIRMPPLDSAQSQPEPRASSQRPSSPVSLFMQTYTNFGPNSKPLGPVPDISPSKFKPYLHSQATNESDEVEEVLDQSDTNGPQPPTRISPVDSDPIVTTPTGSPVKRPTTQSSNLLTTQSVPDQVGSHDVSSSIIVTNSSIPSETAPSQSQSQSLTQQSELPDFSGSKVRERDWESVGFKDAGAGSENNPQPNGKPRIPLGDFLGMSHQPPTDVPIVESSVNTNGQAIVVRPDDLVLSRPNPDPDPDMQAQLDSQAAEIVSLKKANTALQDSIAALQGSVASLELNNNMLVHSKESVESDLEFFRVQYGEASHRGAELGKENHALEIEKARLLDENQRLKAQVMDSVRAVRLTYVAEIESLKSNIKQKDSLAKLLLEQAHRSGVTLQVAVGVDEPKTETVHLTASELRRRAADWTRFSFERAALEELVSEARRREEVMMIDRAEEEARLSKARQRIKELKREGEEKDAELDALKKELADLKGAMDVFVCRWVDTDEGSQPKRCGEAFNTREECRTHVHEMHLLERPLPDTAIVEPPTSLE